MTETKLDSKLKSIPTKQIQFESTNPNRMTKKQLNSLKQSIEKYGFTKPIWVRTKPMSDGFHIIDGEHRAKAAIDLGLKSVKAYVFEKLDDKQMRVMRQLANKLHGKHDKIADAQDLKNILDDDNLDDLAGLIADSAKNIRLEIDKSCNLDNIIDAKPPDGSKDTHLKDYAETQSITFRLSAADYVTVTKTLARLSKSKEKALIKLCKST